MQVTPDIQKAYEIARLSRQNAHAPYSKFQVGAAVKLKGVAEAVGGCNVENASFGGTICAERGAILQAVAHHGGRIRPEFVVVVTAEKNATPPCGLCLQVLAEFCGDEMPVYLGNLEGVQKKFAFKDLLPHAFRQFQPGGGK
jgi:homotetrameric cytidine deaminase